MRAMVTGAASGIGAAIVRRLAQDGAAILAVDTDADALATLAADTGCTPEVADVSQPIDIDAPLDLAFLNAGIVGRSIAEQSGAYRIADLDHGRWDAVRAVNIDGVVHGTHAAAGAMVPSGGGAIVVTASVAGLIPWAPDPYYTATKHAVVGWVRAIADALSLDGITINAMCPTGVATSMTGRSNGDTAGGRLLSGDQVAAAAIEIARDGGTGRAMTIMAGRDPLVIEHDFAGIVGLR